MKARILTGIALIALVAAACGGSGTITTTTPPSEPTAAPPTTVAEPTTTAQSTTAPPAEVRFVGADGVESLITDTSRIVSLGGDITEILFELGLGDRIVAIDVTTTFPPAATEVPVSGFGQQLAPEPVLGFSPTLVIGDQLTGPPEVLEQLRVAGVPVVILESQSMLEGVAVKIGQLAEILGVPEEGAVLAARVSAEIEEATTLAAQAAETPNVAFLYVRGPQTLLLFGQGMATSAMIGGANGTDVGAAIGVRGAVPLTPEALIAAAPDVIVLPEAGVGALGGLDAVADLPGVGETPAGQSGSFLTYDEAYFFNFGPRVGQALKEFVLDLHPELVDA